MRRSSGPPASWQTARFPVLGLVCALCLYLAALTGILGAMVLFIFLVYMSVVLCSIVATYKLARDPRPPSWSTAQTLGIEPSEDFVPPDMTSWRKDNPRA